MVLLDVNPLIYATFATDPRHARARVWLEATLEQSREEVALTWTVLGGFIRVSTSPGFASRALVLDQALDQMNRWLAYPSVRLIAPTERHADLFPKMLRAVNARGNLVSDAHLAALAIEHGCRIASTDRDFARFPGLEWEELKFD